MRTGISGKGGIFCPARSGNGSLPGRRGWTTEWPKEYSKVTPGKRIRQNMALCMDNLFDIDHPILDTTALFLLIPFMALGIHALRRRFVYHDEWGMARQAVLLIYALITTAIEIETIRAEMREAPEYLIFASLGMLAATMALYGHIAVSFLSKLMVDMFLPGGEQAASQPRFGPAEALERLGDYQGALNEYYVLARIFPGRPEVMSRIAGALEALQSHEEAVYWLERALDAQDRPAEAASVLWRLLDLQEHRQARPDLAAEACASFLSRFPETAEAGAVRERQHHLLETARSTDKASATGPPPGSGLVRLEDRPLDPKEQT